MTDKYIAKVIKVIDDYTIVINKGRSDGINLGAKFLVIGVGETIIDPDTKEELERLEIIRGKAEVTHVQEKISTLKSSQYDKKPDKKEITKITTRKGGRGALTLFDYTNPAPETTTESIIPGDAYLLEFDDVQIGDFIIKA